MSSSPISQHDVLARSSSQYPYTKSIWCGQPLVIGSWDAIFSNTAGPRLVEWDIMKRGLMFQVTKRRAPAGHKIVHGGGRGDCCLVTELFWLLLVAGCLCFFPKFSYLGSTNSNHPFSLPENNSIYLIPQALWLLPHLSFSFTVQRHYPMHPVSFP